MNIYGACRYNKYAGAKMKQKIEDSLSIFINKLPKFENPIKIKFLWIEKTKKRDLDNVAFRQEIHS
jgi:hypothetical protein